MTRTMTVIVMMREKKKKKKMRKKIFIMVRGVKVIALVRIKARMRISEMMTEILMTHSASLVILLSFTYPQKSNVKQPALQKLIKGGIRGRRMTTWTSLPRPLPLKELE